MILPDAIETSVGSEPQSARPRETDGGVRRKHAGQRPGRAFVFADAGSRVLCSEGPLAADHDIAVGSEDKIEGAQLRSSTRWGVRRAPPWLNTAIVFSPSPEGPTPEAR